MDVQKFKLSTMFSIMFAGAFIAISAAFYYYNYIKQVDAQNETLKSQARTVLNFADVLLESRNEKFFSGQSNETPQIIQNEVFDKFTAISGGKVLFKESSKTPMNQKNLATANESKIIDEFIQNRDLKEIKKIIKIDSKDYYTLSRPIISEKKCLMCHPTWTPNNVIATEIVKIELKDFYDALKQNTILTILTGIVNITIILFLTHYLFNKYVSTRITKILEIIFRVEKGNFVIADLLKNESLEQASSQNEIDRLFRHLQRMVNTLFPVIENVVHASKEIAFQASYSYVKVDNTNEEIKNQNKFLTNSNEKLTNILDKNNEMISSLNALMNNSNESKQTVLHTKKNVTNNLLHGQEAIDAMDNTSKSINDLKLFSNEVSKMTENISDIADETNLISLNAAIEAARAGEHGRSFAVVAEKIRDLAEVSLDNAKEIASVLAKIDSQINAVTKSAINSKESVSSLVENTHTINESFENVEATFNLISSSLNKFQDQFLNESNMLKDVDKNINDVKESSRSLVENATTTKNIINNISNQSAELKSLADGFELITNNRMATRTVTTPPLKAIDNNNNYIYIFDISKSGISFYFADENNSLEENQIVRLKPEKEIQNKKIINCKIVYKSAKIIKNVYFYGAKLV